MKSLAQVTQLVNIMARSGPLAYLVQSPRLKCICIHVHTYTELTISRHLGDEGDSLSLSVIPYSERDPGLGRELRIEAQNPSSLVDSIIHSLIHSSFIYFLILVHSLIPSRLIVSTPNFHFQQT